jgi:DNA-binding transcriptional LysR family regulator
VSQQIRRLEAQLGAELFDRSTTPVTLTVAGEELLGHARAVLGAAGEARAAIDGLRGVVSGRLQLGAIPGIPHLDLAGVLASFHDLHPNVRISLREQHPADLLAGLRRGEHDVVITGLTSPDRPDGIDIEVLSVEPLVLVTALRVNLS